MSKFFQCLVSIWRAFFFARFSTNEPLGIPTLEEPEEVLPDAAEQEEKEAPVEAVASNILRLAERKKALATRKAQPRPALARPALRRPATTVKEAPPPLPTVGAEIVATPRNAPVSSLLAALREARIEKDVDNAFLFFLRAVLPRPLTQVNFTSARFGSFTVDNTFKWKNGADEVFLLMEDKYGAQNLSISLAKLYATFAQAVIYQKKLQDAGVTVTSVALADETSFYLFPGFETGKLLPRTDLPWGEGAASAPPKIIQQAVSALIPFPESYRIALDKDIADNILAATLDHAKGVDPQRKVTEHTLHEYYEDWCKLVTPKLKFEGTEGAQLALLTLYRDPALVIDEEKSTMIIGSRTFSPVNVQGLKVLYNKYSWDAYNERERAALATASDSLLEPTYRARSGAFYTPVIFANHGWQMTQGVLHSKEKLRAIFSRTRGTSLRSSDVIVWDPAAGSGNLIRAPRGVYKIATTLEESDAAVLNKIDNALYTGALDFLNYETLPTEIDGWLKRAAKAGATVVFLMNPPYATANNAGTEEGDSKAGVADTLVRRQMHSAGLGKSSQQLYAQFMYRVASIIEEYSLDAVIALYSKPTFMCSDSYKKFRDFWYDHFTFERGFVCRASAFNADLAGSWGISFTVWTKGRHPGGDNVLHVFDTSEGSLDGTTVSFTGEQKTFYNSDNGQASTWVREPTKKLKTYDAPQMSSGLVVKGVGKQAAGCIFGLATKGNSLADSGTGTWLQTGDFTGHTGKVDALPGESFKRAIALFAARKLVIGTWLNDKDEYLVPDTTAKGYEQWNADAVVYALLHPSNNCASMRKVMYKGKEWTIDNHFFWYTKEEAEKTLAPYPELLADVSAATHTPYVATLLADETFVELLSPEAWALIEATCELWLKSLPERTRYAYANPEKHLLAWDAGWYQLKDFWKEKYREDFDNLRKLHKELADSMRDGVYTYGFLRR